MTKLFDVSRKTTKRFYYFVNDLREKNGLIWTICYMKQCRLHITRYICGKPLLTNNVQVSLTKDGWPKRLLFLHLGQEPWDPKRVRGLLTLMSYTRSIRPNKAESIKIKPKFDTITDEYTGKDYTIPRWFIKKFVKDFQLKSVSSPYTHVLHYLSSKGSAFGKSTLSALSAIYYMCQTNRSMLTHFTEIMGIGSYMEVIGSQLVRLFRHNWLITKVSENFELGKLSIVKDPELKMRVIAMLDYYSQFILRPIHENLMSLLRHFPCDRTYTQNPKRKWSPKGNKFHSLDLSAATDRFPLALQTKLMGFIYDEKFATNWAKILVDRKFTFEGEPYEYRVGQPMGAYSSWAAFTLTHHLVVHWSAHLCGLKDFQDYLLLGDDIVINNDKVASKYKAIMARLGVNISEAKSHVSTNTYEFAKRWIIKGVEVSPLPLKGILQNTWSPTTVLKQLMDYNIRNVTFYKGNSLELISELYHRLKVGKRYFSYFKTKNLCYDFYHIYRYALGVISSEEIRNFFIKKNLSENFINMSEKLIPQFLEELLRQGLVGIAERSGMDAKDQFYDFIRFYKNNEGFDIKQLQDHPIAHGLYNRLNEIDEKLNSIIISPKFDLINCIDCMRLEKIDSFVQAKRDTKHVVRGITNLWANSVKLLNKITESNAFIFSISEWTGKHSFDLISARRRTTSNFRNIIDCNRTLIKQLCLGLTTYDARILNDKVIPVQSTKTKRKKRGKT